jgi:hypothetical protein
MKPTGDPTIAVTVAQEGSIPPLPHALFLPQGCSDSAGAIYALCSGVSQITKDKRIEGRAILKISRFSGQSFPSLRESS